MEPNWLWKQRFSCTSTRRPFWPGSAHFLDTSNSTRTLFDNSILVVAPTYVGFWEYYEIRGPCHPSLTADLPKYIEICLSRLSCKWVVECSVGLAMDLQYHQDPTCAGIAIQEKSFFEVMEVYKYLGSTDAFLRMESSPHALSTFPPTLVKGRTTSRC